MGEGCEHTVTVGEKGTDGGLSRGLEVYDSEVGEGRLGEDNSGDRKHATGDKSTHCVGEDMLEHKSAVGCTESSCRKNVFLTLEAVELHTGSRRHTDPSRQ